VAGYAVFIEHRSLFGSGAGLLEREGCGENSEDCGSEE
jgi:hypothetical protein